jgi:hypothetical protein
MEAHATLAALLGTRVWDSWANNESGEPPPAPRLRCSSFLPWQRPRGVAKVRTARAVWSFDHRMHSRWSQSYLLSRKHTSFILLCATNCNTPKYWFGYLAGMYSFMSFAEGKASWMLNYSWDGNKEVDPCEAMKNLAMAELMAGANVWDTRGHVMSGSNDIQTRTMIFNWTAKHEKTFSSPLPEAGPARRSLFFTQDSRLFSRTIHRVLPGNDLSAPPIAPRISDCDAAQ